MAVGTPVVIAVGTPVVIAVGTPVVMAVAAVPPLGQPSHCRPCQSPQMSFRQFLVRSRISSPMNR